MDWIAELRAATRAFAECLGQGDLDAAVPSCPGWTLADLGEHLRTIHLWAAHAVTEGNPNGLPEPIDKAGLVAAYPIAARHLITVLEEVPADVPAWTFGPEQIAGFWRRRQVHETVVHLYDVILSGARESEWAPSPELAWDGVDEVATMFYPRQVQLGRTEPLTKQLVLTATDLDRTITIGEGEPVELTGTAAEVLLTLWKRIPASDHDVAALLGNTALVP